MAHNSSNFSAAIDPVVNRSFYGLDEDQEAPQFSKIFKVGSDNEPIMSYVEVAGPTILSAKTENEAVERKVIRMTNPKTYTTLTYAGALELSYEAAKDTRNRYARVSQPAAALGKGARQTPDFLTANYLDNAFDTTGRIWDNLELCSTAHLLPDNTTWSNELSTPAALDETALEDIKIALRNIPGTNGQREPQMMKQVIVPSALSVVMEKLAKTRKQVGTAHNTESVVAGSEYVVFDYLTNSTQWFVQTKCSDGLFWDWIEKLQFITDQVPTMLTKVYVAFFRSRFGAKNARCIYGSDAT